MDPYSNMLNIGVEATPTGAGFYVLPGILHHPLFFIALGLLSIIALILKGYSLWHAAQNHKQKWFIALLLVNSLGILEIIYLYKNKLIGGSRKRS